MSQDLKNLFLLPSEARFEGRILKAHLQFAQARSDWKSSFWFANTPHPNQGPTLPPPTRAQKTPVIIPRRVREAGREDKPHKNTHLTGHTCDGLEVPTPRSARLSSRGDGARPRTPRPRTPRPPHRGVGPGPGPAPSRALPTTHVVLGTARPSRTLCPALRACPSPGSRNCVAAWEAEESAPNGTPVANLREYISQERRRQSEGSWSWVWVLGRFTLGDWNNFAPRSKPSACFSLARNSHSKGVDSK